MSLPPVAFLLLAAAAGPDPKLPTPAIARVRVDADTVWFDGTRPADSAAVAYCYVRSARAWCAAPRVGARGAPPPGPDRALRTVRPAAALALGDGWALGCRPQPADTERCGGYVARDARGRTVTLAARGPLPPAARELRGLPVSATPSAWAAAPGALWVGLAGGMSEGQGERGGLLRVDAAGTGAPGPARYVTHAWLDDVTVTAIAPDAGGLWIGTAHPGEYGFYGTSGLLRLEPGATAAAPPRWSRVTAAQGALPDDYVIAVGAGGGVVAVATERGLAVRDGGAWQRRFWRPTIRGDAVAHDLAETPDTADPSGLRFLALQALGVRNLGAVAAAADQAGIDFVALVNGPTDVDSLGRLLAAPAVVRAFADAVKADARGAAPVVLAAIGFGRGTAAAPALKALLRDAERAPDAAVALARMGDRAGRQWVEGELRRAPARGEEPSAAATRRLNAVSAAARLRDPGFVSLLDGLLAADPGTAPGVADSALAALVAYRDPAVWRRLTATAQARPGLRRALLRAAAGGGASDPATRDPAVRSALVALTVAGLSEGDAETQRAALDAATSVARDARVADALVAVINGAGGAERFAAAAEALVELSGRADAPNVTLPEPAPAEVAAVRRYWTAWRAEAGSGFAPVDPEAGRAAARRWLQRPFERPVAGAAARAAPRSAPKAVPRSAPKRRPRG